MAPTPYAELHCHTNFSFLDGASAPDELVERAVDARADRAGRHGPQRPVRRGPFRQRGGGGRAPPGRSVSRSSCSTRPSPTRTGSSSRPADRDGPPRRPRPATAADDPATRPRASRAGPARPVPGCPAIASRSRRTCAASASASAARTSSCSPGRRSAGGACAGSCRGPTWPARRACRASARRSSPSTPRASSRCRAAATGSWPAGCGRATCAGARAVAERYATLFGRGDGTATSGFFIELSHHLLPDDDWLVAEAAALAEAAGLPVVVTNDVHYAAPEDRELADVLTAIRHGRSLETLGDLRRPDGESYLKSGAELAVARGVARRRGGSVVGGGDVDGGRARGVVLGRSRLRAVPLPGLPGPRRRDAVLVPLASCAGPAPGSATTR